MRSLMSSHNNWNIPYLLSTILKSNQAEFHNAIVKSFRWSIFLLTKTIYRWHSTQYKLLTIYIQFVFLMCNVFTCVFEWERGLYDDVSMIFIRIIRAQTRTFKAPLMRTMSKTTPNSSMRLLSRHFFFILASILHFDTTIHA